MESQLLDIALDAAVKAGEAIRKNFRSETNIRHKTDRELVSDVDLSSEELITSIIHESFPDHSILSEESGEKLEDSQFEWVIDPLDGTHNFLYGFPLYGVSIAVLRNNEPVIGVINLPEFKEVYATRKNHGATLNSEPIHVSDRKLEDSMLFIQSQFHSKKKRKLKILGELATNAFSVRMFGVATASFAWIAAGRSDFFSVHDFKLWDVAAGALIVSEAGGKVTDFYGRPWNIHSKNIAVSNGVIHNELINILK